MQRNHRQQQRFRRWAGPAALLASLALGLISTSAATLPALAKASWIWSAESNTVCELRKVFTLDTTPVSASVLITADNGYELHVNGSLVGSDVGAASEVWQSVERYDITSRLTKGRNIIGIHGIDLGGVRGVIAAARVELKDQPTMDLLTDGTWRVASEGRGVDYSHPEFVEGADWHDARIVGPMGMAPWGKVAWSESGEKSGKKTSQARIELTQPGKEFSWPEAVAFLGDDCSVYVPLRGDAWGVAFRVGDWSRAYTEFDLPCPSKIGRKLYALERTNATKAPSQTNDAANASAALPVPSPLNGERVGVRGGSSETPRPFKRVASFPSLRGERDPNPASRTAAGSTSR